MADPFVAEIRIFPFNFAPTGWAFCDGQIMPISQNTALFSLLGTTYGGDGRTTFALPDLRGSAPMHPGQGSGLSNHDLGEVSGTPNVTLLESEIPSHNHSLMVSGRDANENDAEDLYWARGSINAYTSSNQNLVTMSPQIASPAGGSLPHNNMQPYLTLYFCIALQGVFPPRS